MKRNQLKQEFVTLADGRMASVTIQKTQYSGFEFEVIVKDGTSNYGTYFHDYALAEEKFEEEVKKLSAWRL